MANAMMMDDPRRALVEARIIERLAKLDEATLRELDAWLTEPVAEGADRVQPGGLSRRQLILTSLLGGVAVAGAGVAGNRIGMNEGLTAGLSSATARVASMNETVERLQSDAEEAGARLQETGERLEAALNLTALYEQLDAVDLDSAVSSGLSTMAIAIGRTGEAAQQLREGFAVARNNINRLDENFAVLDSGLVRAEEAVSSLSALVEGLQERLEAAGEPVAPVADAVGAFFTGLLERIPFGVGDRILETVERVQAVVGAVPESIENINRDLLEPLRAKFFPRDGEDVTVRLLDPLTGLIFLPADRLLSSLALLAENWQSKLEAPAREKIEQRAVLREEIQAYRKEQGF